MSEHDAPIAGLFPEGVCCVFSNRFPEDFRLLNAERRNTDAMTPDRLQEFKHGRYCARRALAQLGVPDGAVIAGDDRAPEWPTGVIGSISHCGQHAAAAVASKPEFDAIGLDIETREALDADLLSMICSEPEQRLIAREPAPLLLAKLIFSAKESVFKSVWPRVRRFIDFTDVEIGLRIDEARFVAIPRSDRLPADLFARLEGRFAERGNLIVTAVTATP
jgi:4'-phosphopantetheinyl transferase EntD